MSDARQSLVTRVAWALRSVRQSWGYEDTAEQIVREFEYLFPDNPTERIAELERELATTKMRLHWANQRIDLMKKYWVRKTDVQPRTTDA